MLPEEPSHHIITVLRLQPGEIIELYDGRGGVAKARIISIDYHVSVKILDFTNVGEDTASSLIVGQGMLKGKKMDLVIQKCTELGVSTCIPVLSSRCQARNVINQIDKKHQRWRRIIESACGQSRRNQFMGLNNMKTFQEFISISIEQQPLLKLLFWEEEKDVHLSDLPNMTEFENVKILLGPEGGFTKEEVQMAKSHGYKSISLGSRILRAETATISVVAILQNLLGNFK